MNTCNFEGLEKHNSFVKLLRFVTVPLLNNISPTLLQKIIRGASPYGKNVIERPGTSHSLEVMYTKHEKKSLGWAHSLGDWFCHNVIAQPKAIRNRLKVVERVLEDEIKNCAQKGEEVKILNVGGGSSRAIIQTVNRLRRVYDLKVKVTTLDKDPHAIELGKTIAEKFSLAHIFEWVQGDVRNLKNLIQGDSVNIVEMVGLLDYFDNVASKKIAGNIFNILENGGLFITANVYPNSEMPFVSNVGWPKMHYKTEKDLISVLTSGGFSKENIELMTEPFKVHIIAKARK